MGERPCKPAQKSRATMIDTFTLLISHGLILLTAWRLLSRNDLDVDSPPEGRRGESDA
jgi:hypothetical protein